MEFTLFYRGQLGSNSKPKFKHELRREFHKQLKVLWSQPSFHDLREHLEESKPMEKELEPDAISHAEVVGPHSCIVKKAGAFRFAPLVCSQFNLTASLDITLLRPGPPGSLVKDGGDIDNRLKTLLDALKAPLTSGELYEGATPEADESPFFCLLEDDSLITGLSVRTDRLLVDDVNKREVLLIIRVKLEIISVDFGNMSFLS